MECGMMECFIIDSSTLMALDTMYPRNIFVSLWDLIYKMFDDGSMFSVNEVFQELKDSQKYWLDYENSFRKISDRESKYFEEIFATDKFNIFKNHGLKDKVWADPFLIACAKANEDSIIITEESSNKHPKRKIPYVCNELNIPCMNLLEFLEYKNVVF